MLVTRRIHRDDAVGIEQRRVALEQEFDIELGLVSEPGAAIGHRVTVDLVGDLQGFAHALADLAVPASLRSLAGALPQDQLALVSA